MTLEDARPHLTPKQFRVLELRLAGHSWATIARALHISKPTARGHHAAALDTISRLKETTP